MENMFTLNAISSPAGLSNGRGGKTLALRSPALSLLLAITLLVVVVHCPIIVPFHRTHITSDKS